MLHDRVKYFRRRQFVLGPEFMTYEGWKRLKVDDDLLITVHPDLPTTVVEEKENKAVLLGYAIDPYNPSLDDATILRTFVNLRISLSDVIEGLEKLSGRFIMIVIGPNSRWLFPDACALRQVNYCKDDHGAIWCASQADTLAERLGHKYDDEVLSYRGSPAYRSSMEEFWIMNDPTPYREIKSLLSNHYLDLQQGRAFRFWPAANCIGSLSMDESIKLSAPILQNSIKSAARRFDLKMGISAGSDSRRSLAAAKDVKKRIYFFTHTPRHGSVDIKIPARLLPKLGIEHHILNLQPMSLEFREQYEQSATWARERRGQIAQAVLSQLGPDTTVLNSDRSEVHECWNWLPKSKINGEGLAIVTSQKHPFAIREFQKWLDDAHAACLTAKMDIMVLYDLELRSRWVAAAYSEFDIAYETFCPYNNRHLFSLELSVQERFRRSRQLTLIRKQIKYMWPEVLTEPINPPDRFFDKIGQFILQAIIHKVLTPYFPVYDYLRYLKLKQLYKNQPMG